MASESLDPVDVAIAERLARYQRALANRDNPNATLSVESSNHGDLDSDARRRLESGQRVLALLAQAGSLAFGDERISTDALPDRSANGKETSTGELGRFELVTELGCGGFGVVYLARDTMLGRLVALKVPLPEILESRTLRERFLREARTAAALNHPNLVPIYEAGELGVLCFIAYEYCPGPTLARWLAERERAVAPRWAAELAARMAAAVAHAHARGICHRDIKPGNILLYPFEANDDSRPAIQEQPRYVPKLTDFGLARSLESPHSASGQLLGTIRYMSPEQAGGRSSQVGPASDVYSLGVVLYELLAGRPPLLGESDVQTLQLIASEPPTPLRRVHPTVPKDVETICMKCLAKEPEGRYPSAQELAEDLERYLAGKAILARPIGWIGHGWLWTKRNPVWAALLGVLTLSLIGLVSGLMLHTATLDRALDLAEKHKRETLQREERLREYLSATNLRLAQQSLSQGNFAAVEAYLQKDVASDGQKDLRGLAWYWLWRQAHAAKVAYAGHDGEPVYAASFSLDGNTIASAGEDGVVRVWDARSGKDRLLLHGHDGEVAATAFSSDGSLIATGGEDATVRIWDARDGESVHVFEGHQRPILAVRFVGEQPRLAAAARDGILRIWDVDAGKTVDVVDVGVELREATPSVDGRSWCLLGHHATWLVDLGSGEPVVRRDASYRATALSQNGELLARSDGPEIQLWRPDADKLKGVLRGMAGNPRALAFSGDAETLVASFDDGTMRLWKALTSEATRLVPAHAGRIYSAEFSRDGNQIVTAGEDGYVRIWDLHSKVGDIVLTSNDARLPVGKLAFVADPSFLALPCHDERIHLLDSTSLSARSSRDENPSTATALAAAPSGGRLAKGDTNGVVNVYTVGDSRLPLLIQAHSGQVDAIAFSKEGNLLASGGRDRLIRLWSIPNGKAIATLTGHEGSILGLAFLPSGRLASIGVDQTLRIWNPPTAEPVANIPLLHPPRELRSIGSKDSVVIVDTYNLVSGWNMDDDAIVKTLIVARGENLVLGCSPDGGAIALGTSNGTITLHDLPSGEQRAVVREEGPGVVAIAFAPDGLSLAVLLADATLELFDVKSLQRTASRRVSADAVVCAPDDETLAVGSATGDIRLFSLTDGVERETFRARSLASVNDLVFDDAGRTLWVAKGDGQVEEWGVSDKQCRRSFPANERSAERVCVSGDVQWLCTQGDDRRCRLWRLPDVQQCGEFTGVPVGFAKDSRRLFAHDAGEWLCWDIDQRRITSRKTITEQPIRAAAASPDGNTFAACTKRSIHVVNGDGETVERMDCAADIASVQFTANGEDVVVGLADGTARFFNLAADQMSITLKVGGGAVEHLALTSDDRMLITSAFGLGSRTEVIVWRAK